MSKKVSGPTRFARKSRDLISPSDMERVGHAPPHAYVVSDGRNGRFPDQTQTVTRDSFRYREHVYTLIHNTQCVEYPPNIIIDVIYTWRMYRVVSRRLDAVNLI